MKTNVKVGHKIIGYVENETFYKTIRGSRHLLRNPRAICFDIATLIQARAIGAKFIQVYDKETRFTYHASMDDLFGSNSFPVNYGFNPQRGLALKYWEATHPDAAQPGLL